MKYTEQKTHPVRTLTYVTYRSVISTVETPMKHVTYAILFLVKERYMNTNIVPRTLLHVYTHIAASTHDPGVCKQTHPDPRATFHMYFVYHQVVSTTL